MKRLGLAALLALSLAGCAQAWPWLGQAQQRACGQLDAEQCADVIARVEAAVPETAGSRLVVADLAEPPGVHAYGAFTALVSFVPWDRSEDLWLSPPTWTVSKGAAGWIVEPWRGQALPDHFARTLADAGVQP